MTGSYIPKKLSIKEWSVEDRPREKLLSKGISALGDAEILAILIGSGTKDETAVEVAKRILYGCNNNLAELGKQSVKNLCKVKGIGEARAITIVAALELGRRRSVVEPLERRRIASSSDVAEIFQPLLTDLPHEEFWIILLNRSNKIIEKHRISQGGLSGTVTDIRIIMKLAIDSLASGIIAIHNHPSGNRFPSDADKNITEKLKQASSTFDIQLLDHVIVAHRQFFSFADEGLI
jgi:DNA repair protein radc